MALQFGSRNNDVKTLQQMLVDAKLLPSDMVTGYFGPNTQNALIEYQKKIGVNPTGVYDDATINRAEQKRKEENVMADPVFKYGKAGTILNKLLASGDPRAQYYLNALDEYKNNPYYTATGVQISPEYFEKALDTTISNYSPYYETQQNFEGQGYQNKMDNEVNDYTQSVFDLGRQTRDVYNNLTNTEGIKGTWASSARKDRQQNLQDQSQSAYNKLYNQTVGNINEINRNQQYRLGTYSSPNISSQNVNLGGQQASITSSNRYQYNPFQQTGLAQLPRETIETALGKTKEAIGDKYNIKI